MAGIATLVHERASTWEQMKSLSDKAASEGRDLTAEEFRQYERMEADVLSATREIQRLERDAGVGPPLKPHPGGQYDDAGFPISRSGSGSTGVSARTAVLAPEQRMADWAQAHDLRSGDFTAADADQFCLGNIMRALVEPAFRSELSDVERRALAEGAGATGGFITPEILSASIIDRVRNAGRIFEAGAQTVPLDTDQQSIPRLAGDPIGAWRNENTAFAESQHSFERVTFTPQSYGFIVRTSEELFQDAVPGAGAIIENAIVQTAALELDRVALRGSGVAPEPRGVRNQAGVTITSLGANGGTLAGYTNLMGAVTTLLNANRNPTGVILAPRTSQKIAGFTDSTGQPLNAPRPIADLPFYPTNQVPTNLTQGTATTASEVFVGAWSDLLVGIRLGIQLRLLSERYADNGQFAWRVFLRADVQLAHPESFNVLTGVLD